MIEILPAKLADELNDSEVWADFSRFMSWEHISGVRHAGILTVEGEELVWDEKFGFIWEFVFNQEPQPEQQFSLVW